MEIGKYVIANTDGRVAVRKEATHLILVGEGGIIQGMIAAIIEQTSSRPIYFSDKNILPEPNILWNVDQQTLQDSFDFTHNKLTIFANPVGIKPNSLPKQIRSTAMIVDKYGLVSTPEVKNARAIIA